MGRYTGPIFRKARRLKFSVLENNREFLKGKKRNTIPGQHGLKMRRKKPNSPYTVQLFEKQKIKHVYGLREKQLKNLFKKCKKEKGLLGTNLLISLESRLDNLVFRLNIASTRRQARQFVVHGLILVNNKKSTIPSMRVKINDVITVKSKFHKNKLFTENMEAKRSFLPFVEFDAKKISGKYLRFPRRDELNSEINEIDVVEYFSK